MQAYKPEPSSKRQDRCRGCGITILAKVKWYPSHCGENERADVFNSYSFYVQGKPEFQRWIGGERKILNQALMANMGSVLRCGMIAEAEKGERS